MDDGARNRELWGNAAYGWQILANNNYMAELAAIHKSLRSVPVNVALDIHTDSQSAIDAIKASLRNPEGTNYLRKGGRPYVMAICRAWTSRQEAGADTTLRHVRAHTGERTTAAIGNAVADRWAKWYAMSADEGPDTLSCLDLMAAELPYCGPASPRDRRAPWQREPLALPPMEMSVKKADSTYNDYMKRSGLIGPRGAKWYGNTPNQCAALELGSVTPRREHGASHWQWRA